MEGKVAVITGASSGLGRGLSLRLAKLGVRVVVADVTDGNSVVKEIEKDGGQAVFVKCDVTKSEDLQNSIKTALTKYGGLDIMVNNAGISVEEFGIRNTPTQKWKKMVDINTTAVIEGTFLAVEEMIKSGKGGVIVNTASMAGLFPQEWTPVYAATKSSVVHFTRSLAHLHQSDNIRVSAICPAFAKTAIIKDKEKVVEQAFGRVMNVDEVVDGFMELITDKNNKGGGAIMSVTPYRGLAYPPSYNKQSKL
eukprot:TRINITY_DN3073_c0_g1_i2.p1 TRINITY_DN3073_c0_g1~~TRINITY_DN3073_c0_g1_i2.p1  ORF type:complete len:251 (-),score=31.84 TRINITY_DN3073_c0_g1_i2:731-1483(-)